MASPDRTPAAERGSRGDLLQVVGIGTTGGVFSSLFGVGGGAVMVPLLVLWRGLDEKRATGTSLLAIAIIAAYAVISYAVLGHLAVGKGLLIGLPAVAGVIFGTWLQQRVSSRALSGFFSCLLLVVIVLYLLR